MVDQHGFVLPSGETGDPELVMLRERWQTRVSDVADGQRYELLERGEPLSAEALLTLWEREPAFADWYSALLASSPHAAVFWENPPWRLDHLDAPAEFVLLDAPTLARMTPDADSFRPHFPAAARSGFAVFPNLSGDALLIAPAPAGPEVDCTHLAAFLRSAPPAPCARLWQTVADAVRQRLGTAPLWLSTSGTGVAWLHVRLDRQPKYYQYGPYREMV